MRRSSERSDRGPQAPRGVQRYVLPTEQIVLATRHHWGRLAEPVITSVVVFLVVGWLVDVGGDAFGGPLQLLWWLWVVALARVAWRFAQWRTEWFVATDKRMLLLYGLVTRKVAMMPLGKVTDMSYSRSVGGRLLGYGEFVLESAGQDQAMRSIPWVAHPDATYRDLCATIFGGQAFDRYGLSMAGSGSPPATGLSTAGPGPAPTTSPEPAPGRPTGPWPRMPQPDRTGTGSVTRSPGGRPRGEADTQPIVVPGRPATPQAPEDGPAWHVSDGGGRFVAIDRPDPYDD